MPTINLEMMKQLLQEFSEKESLTNEEINVIEKEISTLKERIGFCRNKLKNLGADKEKLDTMKERYIKGNFSQYVQAASSQIAEQSGIETSLSDVAPDQSISGGIKSLKAKNANRPTISDNLDDKSVSVDKTADQTVSSQVQPPISSPAETEISSEEKKETKTKSTEQIEEETTAAQEGNEPIKSINDALKGLFRK